MEVQGSVHLDVGPYLLPAFEWSGGDYLHVSLPAPQHDVHLPFLFGASCGGSSVSCQAGTEYGNRSSAIHIELRIGRQGPIPSFHTTFGMVLVTILMTVAA